MLKGDMRVVMAQRFSLRPKRSSKVTNLIYGASRLKVEANMAREGSSNNTK